MDAWLHLECIRVKSPYTPSYTFTHIRQLYPSKTYKCVDFGVWRKTAVATWRKSLEAVGEINFTATQLNSQKDKASPTQTRYINFFQTRHKPHEYHLHVLFITCSSYQPGQCHQYSIRRLENVILDLICAKNCCSYSSGARQVKHISNPTFFLLFLNSSGFF